MVHKKSFCLNNTISAIILVQNCKKGNFLNFMVVFGVKLLILISLYPNFGQDVSPWQVHGPHKNHLSVKILPQNFKEAVFQILSRLLGVKFPLIDIPMRGGYKESWNILWSEGFAAEIGVSRQVFGPQGCYLGLGVRNWGWGSGI